MMGNGVSGLFLFIAGDVQGHLWEEANSCSSFVPSVKGLRLTTTTAPFVQFDRTMVEDQIFYRTRMIDPEVMFFYRMM